MPDLVAVTLALTLSDTRSSDDFAPLSESYEIRPELARYVMPWEI
jgi:hypothetical protein